MYECTHYSKETLWGVFILLGQQIKLKFCFHLVLYWINRWKQNLKAECGAALMAILLAWPSAMQPQTMSRPEPGRPAGWGLSMAGSLAINIYSASRVVNTPGAWAAQSGRKSQHTHAQTQWSAGGPVFPPSAITAQADRLDPPSVVFDLIASSGRNARL